MKKYRVSYSDLVLNTLLDSIKRENRYTIDTIDVINYEKVIRGFIEAYDIPMILEDIKSRETFVLEIDKFVVRKEFNGIESYTLLPWIEKEKLESTIENTIFNKEDMEKVFYYTSRELLFKRDIRTRDNLNEIGTEINKKFLESTKQDIETLEKQKNLAQDRLYMINHRLSMTKAARNQKD